jgi:S-formylglutathione hydrolase FrmB
VEPWIERRYGRPLRIGVLGSSLGGLMALTQANERPRAYDFVGSMSGTLQWGAIGGPGERMIERYQGFNPTGTVFYLDSGGGPGRDNYDGTLEMVRLLEARGAKWGQDLWHWHEPGAAHDEGAWGGRVFRPLRIFESL